MVQAEKTVRGVAVEGGRTTRVMVELDDILGAEGPGGCRASDVTIGRRHSVRCSWQSVSACCGIPRGGHRASWRMRGHRRVEGSPVTEGSLRATGKVTEIELEVMIPGRIVLFPPSADVSRLPCQG